MQSILEKLSEVKDKIYDKALMVFKTNESENPVKTFKLTLHGEPKAWQRHRASTNGSTGKTFFYDPNTSIKSILSLHLKEELPEDFKLVEGPLEVTVISYKSLPKCLETGWKRLLVNLGYYRPISKPDVDNYAKLVMDTFNKVFYVDDNQITDLISRKFFSDTPRTEIIINYRQRILFKP